MDLSIIIPVFNSENILENLVKKINDSLTQNSFLKNYEIIMVNDFSGDRSWEKIKKLSSEFKNIKGINLAKNFGQHNAIMAGLNECIGSNIITMDDDLQHPPESIKDIYAELQKNYDACYTYYLDRKHSLWKKFVSWLNNLISSYLLNKPLKIYMSSFRGFKRNVLNEILKYKESKVYLDGLIIKSTKKISMINVPHKKRMVGKSNYNFKKLLKLWSHMAINFSTHPIRIATLLGIILKYLILIFNKVFLKEDKNTIQYLIKEKTF